MGMLRKVEEVWKNKSFHDELKGEWDMHSAGDLVVCKGGINGHIGGNIDGFDGLHGGYGIGQRNFEGRMLESCLEKELCVSNTLFNRSMTFRMGEYVDNKRTQASKLLYFQIKMRTNIYQSLT